MRGFKGDPFPIVQAHFRSYIDVRTGGPRWRDHVVFGGLPLAILAGCLILDVDLSTGMSAGLLTIMGLLGAFLFQLMVQLAESAMSWTDARPEKGPATSAHAVLLEELAATAAYASLIAIAAAVTFIVVSTTTGEPREVASAIGLALAAHLVLVLLMVMRRVFAVIQERLNRARTGADLRRVS